MNEHTRTKFLPGLLVIMVMLCLNTAVSADASIDYVSAYSDAIQDAESRHQEYADRSSYNGIGYTIFDMDGDGVKELLVMQITSKHAAYNWVYKTDGSASRYVGQFESDSYHYYNFGYKNGILYQESYKGSVSLFHAKLTADGISVEWIYEGHYDRDGEPPGYGDLVSCYEADEVYELAPELVPLYDTSLMIEASGDSSSWKSEYLEHIEEIIRDVYNNDHTNKELFFELAYIDDDDIPELILNSSIHSDPGYVFTYFGGKFNSFSTGAVGGYIQGSGLFKNSDVHTGFFNDDVYKLEKGQFTTLGEGTYDSFEDIYRWNGEEVTKEE